jgi:hypothetical protein
VRPAFPAPAGLNLRAGASANQTVAELAREHHLSDRRIWDILKVVPEVEPQQTLFE